MLPFFEPDTIDIRVFPISKFQFPQHLQKSLELIYCKTGSVSLLIGTENYSLKEGELAVIFPNTVHSYLFVEDNSEQEFSGIVLISSLKYCGSYTKCMTISHPSNPIISSDNTHSDIPFCIHGLYEEVRSQNQSIYSATCCHAYMELLLSRILPALTLDTNLLSEQPDLTNQLMCYVQKHFQDSLSLDLIAKELNVSKYYLSHVLSKRLHTTLPSYINEFRINHALNLIHLGSSNITEIWTESGFESQRTFNRIFQNKLGVTPTSYIHSRQ